jgi:heptosyltransferase-1
MSAILLVKTTSLGDVIHNLPVVSDIRNKLPGSEIDWVVERAYEQIPELHPGVARTIPVGLRSWRRQPASIATWREIRDFGRALRARRYDRIIDSQGLLKSALVARAAHGTRCGYCAEAAREPLAARFYDQTFAIPKSVHAVERNRWLAAAVLGYAPDGPLDYGIRAEPLAAPWLPDGAYAVLLTAASREDKQWPETHWLALAGELHAKGMRAVLPAGTASERRRALRLCENMRRALAAPPLELAELAGLMAGARVVIGVDTGLTHLAAALGRPVVALYSGSDPALTGVLGHGHYENLGGWRAPPSPAETFAAVERVLC